ncbi:MAG: hypothetical protein Q4B90_04230 [Eubacteriales bacterium]|nr:hypothetical protein [Eubacteriales bacterium]
MKKFAGIMIAALCTFSLTACGSKEPSLEEVEKSIEEGNVTVEDALEKGWVTQEWVDEYNEERVVPAADKMTANAIGDFSTTTLLGEEFTKEDISPVTFFAFMDSSDKDAQAFYDGLTSAYEGVKKNGGEIVVCNKNGEETSMFEDTPFPVLEYNDSLKKATENYKDMIEGMPNVGVWYVGEAFYSAWNAKVESESLITDAEAYKNIWDERNSSTDDGNEGTAAAAVMG